MSEKMRKTFHDLNNTLGAVILNLEETIAADSAAAMTCESTQAALAAALELRDKLVDLRTESH